MRVLVAILAFALTGITAAGAEGLRRQAPLGVRIAPLVIYDYQPGVVVRAYWRAPWRRRHYYPTTGEKPDVGREEDRTPGAAPEPAESFQRSWSTSSTSSTYFGEPLPRRAAPDDEPPAEPKFQAPLK